MAVSFGPGVPPKPQVFAASALTASPTDPVADPDSFLNPDPSFVGGVYVS